MIDHRPWVGTDYSRGRDGRRMLVVGFSHYGTGTHDHDHDDLTNDIFREWVLTGELPFFNQIQNYLGAASEPDFWQTVAFANTLPSNVGNEEDMFSPGSTDQHDAVELRTQRLVEALAPGTILVFSRKAWKLCPDFTGRIGQSSLEGTGPPVVEYGSYARPDGGEAVAYGLRHPLFAVQSQMRADVAAIFAHRRGI